MNYEKEVEMKPIWKVEKLVLLFAVSKDHMNTGSYLDTKSARDA